ncbi:hypothetical protein [Amycolatopsis sp. WQ 127309]|uniref:hypothetical protein n=1 Tax=Amycolatopsis sp. WQ 127309 TaxID=2932773 RepID=UPI001FF1FCC2|nr:hypothetical protein [Amycolatopsis sp. WQ 127309]UOZ03727.1 hypothetical protein MUY22_33385 [Amycolatopsis sp. WQ 127309]
MPARSRGVGRMGLAFAIALAVVVPIALPDADWWMVVAICVVAGAGFGAIMGPQLARNERRMRYVAGDDLARAQYRQACRVARTGRPVPGDARLRDAAVRLAEYELALLRRTRTSTVIWCGVAAGFSLFNGITGSWLGLLGAAGFLFLGAWALLRPQRLERNLTRLQQV